MGQLIHTCNDCGWMDTGDRFAEMCPVCSALGVENKVNPDGAVTNGIPRIRETFSVSPDRSFFSEMRCGFATR